jgi:segregation and condensation protein B
VRFFGVATSGSVGYDPSIMIRKSPGKELDVKPDESSVEIESRSDSSLETVSGDATVDQAVESAVATADEVGDVIVTAVADEANASAGTDESVSTAVPDAPELPLESIVEAILMATDSPVGASRIAKIIGDATAGAVKSCVERLNERYEACGASFRIDEIAKGFQVLTLPAYNEWLRKLLKVRSESRLSQAAMETLAIVAYKQPVLRATVEEIRGVAAGEMLNRLREMNLVKIVGRAEVIGRPLLYGSTTRFLEVFGLASLDELPSVESLPPPSKQKPVDGGLEVGADSGDDVSPEGDQAAADDGVDAFARLAARARESEDQVERDESDVDSDE